MKVGLLRNSTYFQILKSLFEWWKALTNNFTRSNLPHKWSLIRE